MSIVTQLQKINIHTKETSLETGVYGEQTPI